MSKAYWLVKQIYGGKHAPYRKQRTEEQQAVEYIVQANEQWNLVHPCNRRPTSKKKVKKAFRRFLKAKQQLDSGVK
jgi:hypothetical protein